MVARIKSLAPEAARRASPNEIRRLVSELSRGNVLVITGAGLSTESGLRDYRSPGREMRRRPMHAQDFANNPISRQKYWARSFAGYEVLGDAAPNRAHYALADLHRYRPDQFSAHITQNVDGLLQRAGAAPKTLIELHGTLAHITCGACGAEESRAAFQKRLKVLNNHVAGRDVIAKPDGDAEVPQEHVERFRVPRCLNCDEDKLAPAVVFHGGTVPKHVTLAARNAVDNAQVVFIVGSTLTTYSSFSLVQRAKKNGAVVVAVCYGKTRADHIFDLKLPCSVGDTLESVRKILVPEVDVVNWSSGIGY